MKIRGEDRVKRREAGWLTAVPAHRLDSTLNDITGFLGKRKNWDFNVAFPEQTGAHHPIEVMDGWLVCCQR